ncbi:MAG: hypothetical protein U0736_11405 [Gemmataceae bacterium]
MSAIVRPMRPLLLVVLLVLPLAAAEAPLSAAKLIDADAMRRKLGLDKYGTVPGIEKLKIAVLDHGFAGMDGKRAYLPASTVVVEHYDPEFVRRFDLGDPAFRKPLTAGNAHGRSMAQIIWAMTGADPRGPQFFLLNANGPTLFRRAVRYAIEQKVDLILFSGHFEGAGNLDGRGPINAVVDQAINAGILWINAAGNTGGRVYNGRVRITEDGWLALRTGTDPTALRFRNLLDENTVTLTLTWNDYRDEEDAGTDKDLDLYVEDGDGKVLGSSTLRQVPGDRKAEANETRNPRERLTLTDLPASPTRDYRIRVRYRGGRFTSADRIRLLLTPGRNLAMTDPRTGKPTEALRFLDASGWGEVYPPADHRRVITVGSPSLESSVGPTADGRAKPDLFLDVSRARFSNGDETDGSSNAAAYFAGIAAVLKADQPSLRAAHLLALARHPAALNPPRALDGQPATTSRLTPVVRDRVVTGEPIVPRTYNEERALNHARDAVLSRPAQGTGRSTVWVTLTRPDGTVIRLPAEDTLRQTRVYRIPYPAYGEDRLRAAATTREPVSVDATGERGDKERQVYTWRTPTPAYLARLVNQVR